MSLNSPDAYLNINNANLRVFGNVHTNQVHLGNMTVRPSYGLSTVTDVSNTTPDTIQFTNTHTAFTTTGNVTVGKDLTVSGNVEVGTANLFVDTVSGNIGIGTSEPRAALDVRGDVNFHSLLASANGGIETQITDQGIAYKVHSFTSTGTSQITVDKAGFFECLVVAGGGAGGAANGGGGGGGGVVIQRVFVHAGTYDVVVGAGNTSGARDPGHGSSNSYSGYPTGQRGGNSSVFGLLAIGGGNGGGDDYSGVDGGSGGGASDDNDVIPGRSVQNQEGSNGYGNRGGYTRINNTGGAGGGGAGEVGFDIDPDYDYGEANGSWTLLARDGGNGVGSTIRTGSIQYYGGGGGGAQRTATHSSGGTNHPAGVGGKGGGGNGASANGTGSAGSANTGGGGGGSSSPSNGGNGGSGIVVVRYRI